MSNTLRLPGLIDIHVHLRDPGQTHKEDFFTGTCAALSGGITTVFDMPNNIEPVFTEKVLDQKLSIASQKAVCDWVLYFGTDGNNIKEFEKVQNKVIGLKIYLNVTTGRYLLDDENLLERVFNSWPKDKVIVLHAEGNKVLLALKLGIKYNNKLHVTHISTGEELDNIIKAKESNKNISCDVTPHHLFLTKDDEINLKSLAKMKPPLPTKENQEYLWENLKFIDCICTDHAPHTKNEKHLADPAFGVPGLETMLPLLLTALKQRKLAIDDIIRMTNINPQKIFDFTQDKNIYVEVDPDEKYIIDNDKLKTKCGWSPFDGWEVQGRVKNVYIRDTLVYQDGNIRVAPGFGKYILLK